MLFLRRVDHLCPRRVRLKQYSPLPIEWLPHWRPRSPVSVRVERTYEACPVSLHDGKDILVSSSVAIGRGDTTSGTPNRDGLDGVGNAEAFRYLLWIFDVVTIDRRMTISARDVGIRKKKLRTGITNWCVVS